MLAACSICFLKTINYVEVQKYLFGINGLREVKTKLNDLRNENEPAYQLKICLANRTSDNRPHSAQTPLLTPSSFLPHRPTAIIMMA